MGGDRSRSPFPHKFCRLLKHKLLEGLWIGALVVVQIQPAALVEEEIRQLPG
jgi:hypothetical protein